MNAYFQKYTLPKREGKGFFLTPIELKEYIDFEPKRIYYLTDITEATGQHCHYIEKELFVMLKGNSIAVIDKGQGKEEIEFSEGEAIYAPNYIWHGFKDFSDSAILMAITSTNYNPDREDYLEDYDKYLELRDEKIKEIYGV